jgi:hypothetical protein
MNERIIYQPDGGGVVVLIPTPQALAEWGIDAIALKDVPAGRPYKIIETDDLPEDRTFRNAWEVDAAILTDGVGGDSNEFPAKPEPVEEPAVEEPAPTEPAPVEEAVQ